MKYFIYLSSIVVCFFVSASYGVLMPKNVTFDIKQALDQGQWTNITTSINGQKYKLNIGEKENIENNAKKSFQTLFLNIFIYDGAFKDLDATKPGDMWVSYHGKTISQEPNGNITYMLYPVVIHFYDKAKFTFEQNYQLKVDAIPVNIKHK